MKINNPSVLTASLLFLFSFTWVFGVTPTFEVDSVKLLEDFEGYSPSDTIWGTDIVAAAPKQPATNTSNIAMQAYPDSSWPKRLVGWSGEYVGVTFDSNTIFYSGWFNIGGHLGGARVQFSNSNAGGSASIKAGGFGIVDVASKSFSVYTAQQTEDSSWVGAWIQSSTAADYNTWYEIAFVIQMDSVDVSKSTGYYFVRNITAGETDFTLLEDLSGIDMSWYTSELNASEFSYFRVENFNRNGQVDNLMAGTAILNIPEVSTGVTLLGGLLLMGIVLRRIRTVRSL